MYQRITFSDFCDAFEKLGRGDYFSYQGKRALFNHIEETEEDIGMPIELDVIALCCDFTEYENLDAFRKDYGKKYANIDDVINDYTVIPVDNEGFIIKE